MLLNFDGCRPETPTIESAISRREGLLLSVIAHLVVVVALLMLPQLPWVQQAAAERAARAAELERQAIAAIQAERDDDRRFVFVAPMIEQEAPEPPDRGFLSDLDRRAQAPEQAPEPANPLPFALGNTPEPVDAEPVAPAPAEEAGPPELARGSGPEPEPAAGAGDDGARRIAEEWSPLEEGRMAAVTEVPPATIDPAGSGGQARLGGGSLGDALRNLDRYVPPEMFDNPQGGTSTFGPWIDFDTKGVDFGPWIRRFVAQIRRNWFVPLAAMSMRGHVVVTFNVHKDGAITDLTVLKPSQVESFNNSSYNALAASNPTQPLPPEYPADKAYFTVTFYYNESPAH